MGPSIIKGEAAGTAEHLMRTLAGRRRVFLK
jgi:hypothetical protein